MLPSDLHVIKEAVNLSLERALQRLVISTSCLVTYGSGWDLTVSADAFEVKCSFVISILSQQSIAIALHGDIVLFRRAHNRRIAASTLLPQLNQRQVNVHDMHAGGASRNRGCDRT